MGYRQRPLFSPPTAALPRPCQLNLPVDAILTRRASTPCFGLHSVIVTLEVQNHRFTKYTERNLALEAEDSIVRNLLISLCIFCSFALSGCGIVGITSPSSVNPNTTGSTATPISITI